MTDKKVKWTTEQQRAIVERGSDVLVTASAGTGKTAVLSGRCVDIVCDRSICPDVLRILVVTFTDMAAEQMRGRIRQRLKAAYLETKDEHLLSQLMLLPAADISTFHSFCKRLITEYFYKLDLDPGFGIIDSDEQNLIKAEVLEATVDWAWQQSNLTAGLEQLLYRRDLRSGDGFLAKIIKISDFLDGVVSVERWYERAMEAGKADELLGEKQKQLVAKKLHEILSQFRFAQRLCENQGADEWCAKYEQSIAEPLEECIKFLAKGDWESCAKIIRNFKKPNHPPSIRRPKDIEDSIAGLIKDTAKEASDNFARLTEFVIFNPSYLDRVGGQVSLQTHVLIEMVKKFRQLYRKTKSGLGCLDFSDLEHYALKLLTKEDEDGELAASQTALIVRDKYKHIFVDEYQDINPVQEAILKAISGEQNVFVVGDIKQSIYAFRGTDPEIFTERLSSASRNLPGCDSGLRVDLTANWRSAKGILDFVNKVFSKIMTGSFASIDYNQSSLLRPGVEEKDTGDEEQCCVEMHVLDAEGDVEGDVEISEDESVYGSRQKQAVMIGRRIRQIVGADGGKAELKIFDKDSGLQRDVEYRDIVILMRSPSVSVNDYIEMFRLMDMPVICETAGGYFDAIEIRDCLCLLKVLDNPQRDIELAAVLRSQFFKISDSELAKIRIYGGPDANGSFCDCLLRYSEDGPNKKLREKLRTVLDKLEQWRKVSRAGNIADLIWQIYRETNYLAYVLALNHGQQRKANLLKLHDRAIQFAGFAGSSRMGSLGRFVEFIEKLQETDGDWQGAGSGESTSENAVRIMSVHKSKGLEFEVVFLADLNKKFSNKALAGDCLIDAENTLGLQIIERESNSKLSSPAYQVIAEAQRAKNMAEEMRILYVAMTRAKKRLILSCSGKIKKCRDIVLRSAMNDGSIEDWQLGSCKSLFEWVLYGLSNQRIVHDTFETGFESGENDEGLFDLKVYGPKEQAGLNKYIDELKSSRKNEAIENKSKAETEVLLGKVKDRLSWRYQFEAMSLSAAKKSVTELTHSGDEYAGFDYSDFLERSPKAILPTRQAGKVDGRLIGTACHLIISRLDLSKAVTEKSIEETKKKLLADGAITENVAVCINAGSIISFFESDLGKQAVDSKNKVWREWPFSFAINVDDEKGDGDAEEKGDGDAEAEGDDDAVIVQGIIDMLIKTENGLVIIDFKTDKVSDKEINARTELYRQQMELYSRAAGAILKEKVTAKWLYFLQPAKSVKIN